MQDHDVLLILVLGMLFMCCCYDKLEAFVTKKKVCNNIDGRCYPVVTKFENTMDGSEMLAYLNDFSIKLMRHMRRKYLWEKRGSVHHRNMTKMLLDNYNPDNIVENNPTDKTLTSYVEDKGKVFAVCLREKESGTNIIHDKNILEFVVLHEMSHLASEAIGHDDMEFWINFKILIQNAEELGIHTPVNYAKTPVTYCSLHVDYNPYYDKDTPPEKNN
jgi:hypothetical protein